MYSAIAKSFGAVQRTTCSLGGHDVCVGYVRSEIFTKAKAGIFSGYQPCQLIKNNSVNKPRLGKSNLQKQKQIDTDLSTFVYWIKVIRYMFRPSQRHHEANLQ
jgi:hypothetical protein